MPNKPASICGECRCLVPDGGRYCIAHLHDNQQTRAVRDREVERRVSGLKLFYGRKQWLKITKPFILARDPFCMIGILCDGEAVSVDVDHIIRAEIYIATHGGDETYFFDPINLQGACHADHGRKTRLERQVLVAGSPSDLDGRNRDAYLAARS